MTTGSDDSRTAGRLNSLGRFGWVAVIVALVVAASTLTRLVVFALSDHGRVGVLTLAATIVSGAVYDLLVAAWLAAPAVLYLASVSRRRYPRRGSRLVRRGGLALLIAVVTFVAAAEVVFFDEFDGRFNFVAVDYLIFPTEVVTNIWQSYPLFWILTGIAAFTALSLWLLRGTLARIDESDFHSAGKRWMLAGGYAVILAAMTAGVSPRLSNVSDNRVMNEVAANGYYTFWQAFLAESPFTPSGADAPYVGLYATDPKRR